MPHYTLAPVEFDGGHDYLHVLVNYPLVVSVSSLVNSLKGVSSRLIRQQRHPTIRGKLWGDALWSPSYGQLRWRSDQCHSPIHRATALRTASPSTLSFLALKGEVCRAVKIKLLASIT
jgi:Transposase IS200 like